MHWNLGDLQDAEDTIVKLCKKTNELLLLDGFINEKPGIICKAMELSFPSQQCTNVVHMETIKLFWLLHSC